MAVYELNGEAGFCHEHLEGFLDQGIIRFSRNDDPEAEMLEECPPEREELVKHHECPGDPDGLFPMVPFSIFSCLVSHRQEVYLLLEIVRNSLPFAFPFFEFIFFTPATVVKGLGFPFYLYPPYFAFIAAFLAGKPLHLIWCL